MKHSGILIAVFLLLLVAIGGVSAYAFFDPATVSASENRTLTKRPALTEESWFSGAFSTGMEQFLTDHVFERTRLIDAAKRLEAAMERKTEIKLVSHAASDMVAGRTESAPSAAENQSGGASVTEVSDDAQAETQDRLVLPDRILWAYRDAPDNLAYYAKVANSLFAMFPDYIGKYSLLAPSRIAFETPDVALYSDDQRAAIESVYDRLDPLVTSVDAYSALLAHSGRLDDLYFRTDHHWTHLGAYYAAEALFEATGKEYAPLDAYERKLGNPFLGYFYAQDPDPALKEHEDELVYYVPTQHDVPKETLYLANEDGSLEQETAITVNPMRAGYYTFINSSFAYAVLEGAKADAGCILVVADSYGNALSTWLAENYSRVVQIDPRDYTGGRDGLLALAAEYQVTDVLLCDYLGSVDASYFPSLIAKLTE